MKFISACLGIGQIFEEEALAWDEKLNRLRILLDSWVEVQRKWLYLEGVFSGSQDIQMLLPAEHQRFRGIDAEFKGIMKKADTTKVVLEVTSKCRWMKLSSFACLTCI